MIHLLNMLIRGVWNSVRVKAKRASSIVGVCRQCVSRSTGRECFPLMTVWFHRSRVGVSPRRPQLILIDFIYLGKGSRKVSLSCPNCLDWVSNEERRTLLCGNIFLCIKSRVTLTFWGHWDIFFRPLYLLVGTDKMYDFEVLIFAWVY